MNTSNDTPRHAESGSPGVRQQIVDTALALAAKSSWEAVRLRDVADAAELQMADIHRHFREKEDVAEAFFDGADRAMIAAADEAGFRDLPSRERIERLIMAWLNALQPHRRTVRQMIANKLEPGHLHVQIPALLRISRTVQWVREASGRDATFLRRAVEETLLTSIYVSTFVYWMQDDSEGSERTRRLLVRSLARAESLERLVVFPARRSAPRQETGLPVEARETLPIRRTRPGAPAS
jgi:ubiquinone biosynthesis protein COQ9